MDNFSDKTHGEERLRLALEAAEMGYWEWHPATDKIIWSCRTAMIFGFASGEFRGTWDAFLETVHPEDRAGLRQRINSAIEQRGEFNAEYRILRRDGDLRWLSSQGQTFYNDTRQVSIMLGVVRDITKYKQAEEERTRLIAEAESARETAEAANRAKDEFIAQITHDLRSPLNAILGWARVLRSRNVNQQITAEALATIEQSAEKQKRLIEDLLDVSRIVTGKLRLDVQPISLAAVINSAMEVMRPACNARSIDCQIELATKADDITGDPARLEQVIWNLVSNAVKFTPNGGQVKVRLERADPYVQIIVSDTGRGIQPEHLPYIFNRYWQPSNSSKKPTGGLGLGLSLARHIVELHGGTIRAESEGEGKGTKFFVSLPYRAVRLNGGTPSGGSSETTSAKAKADSQKSQLLSGILALVVDDEPDARELVAAILHQHSAEVMTAAGMEEALQLIKSASRLPDVVVSDISMPEHDGYALIRRLRALPAQEGGEIPAIALTAYGRSDDRIHALSAGFQMHVPKPVEPAELALITASLTGRDTQFLNF
ncbi:MAG TPA: ATP-binding protein [Blastocatellia bacterium]|nr:ATP-binding protein [Blastocatellia bacterium]HMV86172.1 ATP-binding protein [Blastocatellia bacterium]HMX24400.1 ATP-binding protein [Blastocatellia bacterium]HMZ16998.1 ATP-binding protein [Blastocatellia bacterium]HNG29959.1 ATP-binding protein [Blastocatellia bacterium]